MRKLFFEKIIEKTNKKIGLSHSRARKFFSTVLTAAVIFSMSSGSVYAACEGLNVQYRSQDEIAAYAAQNPGDIARYRTNGFPLDNYTLGYDAAPVLKAPYYAGRLSQKELLSALQNIKLARYIAGISDEIYLSDEYNSLAQAASVVNYANGKLSHYPAVPQDMEASLAQKGMTGAKKSNIAWTSWQNCPMKWTIISGWLDDSDANNISKLGHRRWILNPALAETGFGAVSGKKGTYSSMYVHDYSNPDDTYYGVCWPAQNMPVSYFNPETAWSISMGEKILSPQNVSVTLIRNRRGNLDYWHFGGGMTASGEQLNTSDGEFYISNDYYGQPGCIIFRPSNIDSYEDGDSFHVEISGLSSPVSYDVNFFELKNPNDAPAPSITKAYLGSVDKPHISWESSVGADSYKLYRKIRGGSWRLLASNLTDCEYDDASAIEGLRYYYKVSAVKYENGSAFESDFSAEKYVTVPLARATIKSAYSSAKKTNFIGWGSVRKASGYKVYRRAPGSSRWIHIKTVRSNYYKDTRAVSGKKYQYRVRPYRLFNGYITYGPYSYIKTVRTK